MVILLLESHLKANIFQHLNVFLVIGMGKEEKKNHVREPKEAHFLILPCEKGDDGIFFFLNPGRFKELFWSTDA